eukprot:COSAG02_NODE_442_length_22243_cov_20.572887_16_plen_122_part_00
MFFSQHECVVGALWWRHQAQVRLCILSYSESLRTRTATRRGKTRFLIIASRSVMHSLEFNDTPIRRIVAPTYWCLVAKLQLKCCHVELYPIATALAKSIALDFAGAGRARYGATEPDHRWW